MRLSKYHGLGNDFIMSTIKEVKDYDLSTLAIKVCDRHTGIGADGLIIVKQHPLEMIYYNSDGSRAAMCGNGIRCFAQYVYDEQIEMSSSYHVQTLAGQMTITQKSIEPFIVEVNMGVPDFNPSSLPSDYTKEIIDFKLELEDQTVVIDSVLLGVPHTTVLLDDLNKEKMLKLGAMIEKNPLFKEGTNVNFYNQVDETLVNMQTFERGAGLTLACGTGACATFAVLRKKQLVKDSITIALPLGNLVIREENNQIFMSGPAEKVCDIQWE